MQERKNGVKRLLTTIQQMDDDKIPSLARLLNYEEGQLKQDIEAIALIEIINKDEAE